MQMKRDHLQCSLVCQKVVTDYDLPIQVKRETKSWHFDFQTCLRIFFQYFNIFGECFHRRSDDELCYAWKTMQRYLVPLTLSTCGKQKT